MTERYMEVVFHGSRVVGIGQLDVCFQCMMLLVENKVMAREL